MIVLGFFFFLQAESMSIVIHKDLAPVLMPVKAGNILGIRIAHKIKTASDRDVSSIHIMTSVPCQMDYCFVNYIPVRAKYVYCAPLCLISHDSSIQLSLFCPVIFL